jgi:DNA-binding PadR family transcriptional regulator
MPEDLPKPLSWYELYILLCLIKEPAHAYAIGSMVRNTSLGSIRVNDGNVHKCLKKLISEKLIAETKPQPTRKSDVERRHYTLTQEGKFRLKEEMQRIKNALDIATKYGLMDDNIPIEIQRLLAQGGGL